MLGRLGFGIFSGIVCNKFKIIGQTILGENYVAVMIIYFAEANVENHTNLMHSALLSDDLPSLSVIIDLKTRFTNEIYNIANVVMGLMWDAIKKLPTATVGEVKRACCEVANNLLLTDERHPSKCCSTDGCNNLVRTTMRCQKCYRKSLNDQTQYNMKIAADIMCKLCKVNPSHLKSIC